MNHEWGLKQVLSELKPPYDYLSKRIRGNKTRGKVTLWICSNSNSLYCYYGKVALKLYYDTEEAFWVVNRVNRAYLIKDKKLFHYGTYIDACDKVISDIDDLVMNDALE